MLLLVKLNITKKVFAKNSKNTFTINGCKQRSSSTRVVLIPYTMLNKNSWWILHILYSYTLLYQSCSHLTGWRFGCFRMLYKPNKKYGLSTCVVVSSTTIEEHVILYSSIFIMFTIWNYYVFNLARMPCGRKAIFFIFKKKLLHVVFACNDFGTHWKSL